MCHNGRNISQLHIDIDINFIANSHQSKIFDVGQLYDSKTRRSDTATVKPEERKTYPH